MLALREAEQTNLKLHEAKRLSRAAFGWSRALESTATGTMLSARRSRFFASGSRTSRPLLRRKERRCFLFQHPDAKNWTNGRGTFGPYFLCYHNYSLREGVEKLAANMLALREAEHTNLKVSEAKRRSRAAFSRSRSLESTATGKMPSARRSRFFASGSRTAWPLLRREERSRT
ncbi:unnamed protein product [Coccothraustes coccothraustes]